MTHCLINQTPCGRKAGEPVCAKCGLDERVGYVGEKDARQAQEAALARWKAAEQAETRPGPEPETQSQPPQPPQPPQSKRVEPPEKPDLPAGAGSTQPAKKANKTVLLVAAAAVAVGGWLLFKQHQMLTYADKLIGDLKKELADAKKGQPPVQTGPKSPESGTAAKAGSVFKDCADCPEMVVIPAGSFMMGSSAAEQELAQKAGANKEWTDPENPLHKVTLRSFALGKYEVTQGQWKAVMGNKNPSHFSTCGDDCPVENVRWDDIQIYIQKLNRMTGQQYRLPSEAEWEYAARAGCTSAFNVAGQCKDRIEPGEANFNGNYTYNGSSKGKYERKTMAFGSFAPNGFGLHDMHGNVWEWVQDCYEDDYRKGQPVDGSAHRGNDSSCSKRVLRGGSWLNNPISLRAAYRLRYSPGDRNVSSGFRLARMLP